ncbi:MAG: hypothetical protein LQ345_006366 [Seirophora villosa]|nr:MAG: hypothetical protein LQ345_006366 [Seirophora villosa]
MPHKSKAKRATPASIPTRDPQNLRDNDSSDEENRDWLSVPMSELFSEHFQARNERKPERVPGPSGFDTPPDSNIFNSTAMPDHPIEIKAPPHNINNDPYGINDPWNVKDLNPVIDRGEIWQMIDDPQRREAGCREWEQAQQLDLSAKAEELYPEAPDFLDMPRGEYHRRKVDELFKHRDARRFEIIKVDDIYNAIRAGPAVIKQLRDWERRWILDKEGVPPKRPITSEDLDVLYANYVNLLGAPGHKFPGCVKCEKAAPLGKFYYHTIKKMTREGGESDEAWHFRDNREAKFAEHACKRFLKTLVGFEVQKKKAAENALTVAENTKREEAGKKPIPLNETRVERLSREIEEGTRTLPPTEAASHSETEDEAAIRFAKEVQASQERMGRIRAEEDIKRTQMAWQGYQRQEQFLKSQGQSAADALERPYSLFATYYPCGLPYKGELVYNKADIKPEDWERFKENRAAFEEEEGKTLPEGVQKRQWDEYIEGILKEYKPPRSMVTEEAKATHLETLFSKTHLDHIVNTPL